MPEMTRVNGSNVAGIGYDANEKELHVDWQSGRTSIYEGVPADVAERVMAAPSVGKAVNAEIKPFYDHRYV